MRLSVIDYAMVAALLCAFAGSGVAQAQEGSGNPVAERALGVGGTRVLAAQTEHAAACWKDASGSYGWRENAQCSVRRLRLRYISPSRICFEFNAMQGSESGDSYAEMVLSGVALIGPDGKAVFQDENATLAFSLAGEAINVAQKGKLRVAVDGIYDREPLATFECTPGAAAHMLAGYYSESVGKPPVITAKNVKKMVGDWFYPVVITVPGEQDSATREQCYFVARDLSAIYENISNSLQLRWGSAGPMMKAEALEAHSGSGQEGAWTEVVDFGLRNKRMRVGETGQPWIHLPVAMFHTLKVESSRSDIVSVGAGGKLTALAPGKSVITMTVEVNGATKTRRCSMVVSAK